MKGRADDAGPNDPIINASPLVDGILALLEEAGCPTELNDEIVRLVEKWEYRQLPTENEPNFDVPPEGYGEDCWVGVN
jgi:hypothetical protein